MLHHVTPANRGLYTALLADMHAWRKRVFMDAAGWKLAERDGGEYDAYDDDRAHYFLQTDDADGTLLGAVRMRTTEDRSMIGDHFTGAYAIRDRALADGTTWEITRGFRHPSLRGKPFSRQGMAFIIAQMEAARAEGMDRIVGYCDLKLVPWFMNVGYAFRLVGLPFAYDEGTGIAFEYAVDDAAITHMRDMWQIQEPILFDMPNAGLDASLGLTTARQSFA